MIDGKEYANQMRENAVTDKNGNVIVSEELWQQIANIIETQQAEIEELNAEIDKQYEQAVVDIKGNLADGGVSCHWCIEQNKAEAIKEFADRLKEEYMDLEFQINTKRKTLPTEFVKKQVDWVMHEVFIETINALANEMVGAENG